MNPDHTINENDVLCGRGGGTNNHKGNIIFRHIVASRQYSYLNAQKAEKKLIANSIVDEIRKKGGRFLKYSDLGVLEDIGDIKANEKTCQALREGMDIRTHTKEQHAMLQAAHEMDNQMPSTFYPRQHHHYHDQGYYHTYPAHLHPPTHSPLSFERNYNRAYPQEHVDYGIQRQNQWPIHNRYGEGPVRRPCQCSKSNCLKMYCHCYSNSAYCQPLTCQCKDCQNTPDHMQRIIQSRSHAPDTNTSIFQGNPNRSINNNMHASDNKYHYGNQHRLPQTNQIFSHAYAYAHYPGIQVQGTAPVMNSHFTSSSSMSPISQYDRLTRHKIGCKCQKSRCIKRYCECYNAGIKCSQSCQCMNCRNA